MKLLLRALNRIVSETIDEIYYSEKINYVKSIKSGVEARNPKVISEAILNLIKLEESSPYPQPSSDDKPYLKTVDLPNKEFWEGALGKKHAETLYLLMNRVSEVLQAFHKREYQNLLWLLNIEFREGGPFLDDLKKLAHRLSRFNHLVSSLYKFTK